LVGGSARDLIFFLIFIVIALIAAAIIKDAPVIGKLSDASFARGLITFIISCHYRLGIHSRLSSVCFTRRSAAMNAFGEHGGVHRPDGGFRNIVGSIWVADKLAPLQIAPIRAAAKHITTHISGGYAPYRYSINLRTRF